MPTSFEKPPAMLPVPKHRWLMQVYAQDVLQRLEEIKATITSQFGRVLKMDSTKKGAHKLAGHSAGTATWVTNVGNEHGQVIMMVLTASEGFGLAPMVAGIIKRYKDAAVSPPELLYVNRDCCGGMLASDTFFQAYLLDGLARWTEDRADAATSQGKWGYHSYSGLFRHATNVLGEDVLGQKLVPFTTPHQYTGELIVVEYLYQQTGEAAKVYKSAIQELETADVCVAEDESYEEPVDIDDLTLSTLGEEDPPRVLPSTSCAVPSENPHVLPSAALVFPCVFLSVPCGVTSPHLLVPRKLHPLHSLQRLYKGQTETCLVRCLHFILPQWK
ncbi:hypothetical protein ROHU_001849 [Labeo rohita]|uniref:Uncharacterized protein n=1 Tax=Labeo rohita TaxID=84645 RepID=A0A498P143_LABRO|nr:hypothetical protein ROHU_013648 [Labeo rohita]RXN37656.1 hypothetical protein ROHU_001849 [Labeo rohita]